MEATWKRVMSARQMTGLSFLWKETSRSLKLLFAVFVIFFALYWLLKIAASPLADLFKYGLGLMLSFALVLFLFETSPRLRPFLPRSLHPSDLSNRKKVAKHILAILAIGSLIVFLSLGTDELVILFTSIMGMVGGIYLLLAAENSIHLSIIRLRREHPRMWKGSWSALALMLLLLIAYIALEVSVATNNPSTEARSPFVELIVLFAMLIAAQLIVVFSFILIRILAALRRRRPNGILKRALSLDTHPFSQFFYLEGIQHTYVLMGYLYIVLIVYQALTLVPPGGEAPPLGWHLIYASVPTELLQILIFGSFALSWISISFNLIGMAVGEKVPLLNRHNLIPISLLVLMVLLMHTIVVQANEIVFSLILRASYLLGLVIGPVFVLITRLRKIKAEQGTSPAPE